MRRIRNVFALGTAICVILSWTHTLASPARGQEPPRPARPSVATPPNSQQNQDANERLLKRLAERIKGRENDPAEQVFTECYFSGPSGLGGQPLRSTV
jgi:hypothetical protein